MSEFSNADDGPLVAGSSMSFPVPCLEVIEGLADCYAAVALDPFFPNYVRLRKSANE